ncbi:acyl-CoA dehydrogenase [Haliea atlantica]
MLLLSLLLFFALLVAVLYLRPSLQVGTVCLLVGSLLLTALHAGIWLVLLPLAAVLAVLNVSDWRRRVLVQPAWGLLRQALPPMSDTEREAIEAGTTWWEKDLFSGQPDWQRFAGIRLPRLSEKEQAFLDKEVEELCSLIDEWEVQQRQDLPEPVWDFLRQRGFFGLIIPETFGGRDFSPYAQSCIMSKIASRSLTAAVTAMVPNSLGPGELLVKYGTEEQQQRWLPGLADGSELPCFGLTGPEVGSDAGGIPDLGVVCRGEFEGREVLGIRLTFHKRWITLAPVATVVGLAFRLQDPEGLLGDPEKSDYGITCALLPADHPGVEIGRRHNPGAPFMNGPVQGSDVFIPVDWIIGGPEMAGKGWRMLIECLGAGRGVSLPALATASGEMCYLTVGAWSRIRRQFNLEVGKFEGVQEATAQIAAGAYLLEAMRQFVTRGLEEGTPSVLTAMAKYHATERMRQLVNHGMDVIGGRGIQLGPRNFLGPAYHALPVAITVEGANILTRSLMIFGQGAIRCHPYLLDEMTSLQAESESLGLDTFEPLLLGHLGHVGSNGARALCLGLSRGLGSPVPDTADSFSQRWYQRINHLSAAMATCADAALGVLGGELKRREMLSARLGDAHSQLLMACAVLKFHDSQPRTAAGDAHARFAIQQCLHEAQEALIGFCDNFNPRVLGCALRGLILPFGRCHPAPSDSQVRELGDLIMQASPVRKLLAGHVYLSQDPEDAVGRVETTYQLLLEVEEPFQAFARARAKGEVTARELDQALDQAVEQGVIRAEDREALKHYEARRRDCLLTDHFESL